MIYNEFAGERISALGFGTMRLPLKEDGKTIDRDLAFKMVDYALENGVNYFDTAVPYHSGMSEIVIGDALSRHPRESFLLADKFPGHQPADSYDPAATFETQLRRCKVDYFDFYLMHNITESSWDVYSNPEHGILKYFVEQKKLGRIKHLGFSSHAELELLRTILDSEYGEHMEFCQIQLNYLDWTLQKAREKCDLLASRNIPVWVMEPLRGGKLANLCERHTDMLKELRPDESTAAWGFRWLQDFPEVKVVLSGMSDMNQMVDNIKTFEERKPLTDSEKDALAQIAEDLKSSVPCTGCRYCCDGCPMELDIPTLVAAYNDLSVQFSLTPMMRLESMPEEKRPHSCIGCGACTGICPQKIDVPKIMEDLAAIYDRSPKWSEICVQRAAEAAKIKED